MEVKIAKWGNSMALRLPKSVINDLQLSDGSVLDITVRENKLIGESVKKKYNLIDLLKEVNSSNIHSETNTGNIVGKEV